MPLPVNHDLVIYELFVSDFAGDQDRKGTFKDVQAKLDYIRDLGVNAIEFLPVKEFGGEGWGYSLRSLFGVDNTYGTPDEFCELIDECHARGIRVIIDGVYNHAILKRRSPRSITSSGTTRTTLIRRNFNGDRNLTSRNTTRS